MQDMPAVHSTSTWVPLLRKHECSWWARETCHRSTLAVAGPAFCHVVARVRPPLRPRGAVALRPHFGVLRPVATRRVLSFHRRGEPLRPSRIYRYVLHQRADRICEQGGRRELSSPYELSVLA